MSVELNNYLLDACAEDQDEVKVADQRGLTREKALVLFGLLAGIGAVGVAGKANADELLLCTYYHPEIGVETVVNDPESDQDQATILDLWNPLQLSSGASQEVYKGYILKPMCEYVEGGTCTWRVFKKVNGQDVEKGILMNIVPINLLTPSGVLLTNGKTFHKVTDTGETLVAEEVGTHPGGATTNFGGYIFSTRLEADGHVSLMTLSESDILNHTGGGMVPIASIIELSSDSSKKYSTGINVDESTNTLVVSLEQGTIEIDLTPFLDENGQLPPDFSLTDATLGEFKPFPPKPGDPKGYKAIGVLASNGYRYHAPMGGEVVIMQKPDGQFVVIDKEQLNGGTGVKIYSGYELVHGGVYIIFDNPFEAPSPVPPVVLHESGEITKDPGDMTPFIKNCFVIPEEYQDMFAPPVDKCAGVTCEKPTDPCKESAGCDPVSGACSDKIKLDGTPCDDGSPDTTNDVCANSVCAGKVIPVEQSPEVVEQATDVVEQGEIVEDEIKDVVEAYLEEYPDVIEQEPDTVEPNPEPDGVEQTSDTVEIFPDSSNEIANPDAKEYLQVEVGTDSSEEDTKGEIGADTSADTGNEDIQTDTDPQEKSPGCGGCATNEKLPDTADGTLLLGLGALLVGLTARFRNKILSALMAGK